MKMEPDYITDIMIIGSGFSGSILSMALRKSGYRVMIIEKSQHPRFAIGESSTPIADMILRDLAEKYSLPVLAKLSRYGHWQKHYPELLCGLKRGFSYYSHQPDTIFRGDSLHENELLVAASRDNLNSDTNWFRRDTDHFLAMEAEKSGALLFENSEVVSLTRDQDRHTWSAVVKKENQSCTVRAEWIIDGSGSPWFSGRFLGTRSSSSGFKTHTSALFSHFWNVPYWTESLAENGSMVDDYPYNPDHSALHHIIEEGWLWMLRFHDGRLSSGFVFDHLSDNVSGINGESADTLWNSTLDKYPSLKQLFANATLADEPGRLIATGRLQRKLDRVAGDGWFALPHTAGFVDPMHSTGIAHTLTGVERLLSFFTSGPQAPLKLNSHAQLAQDLQTAFAQNPQASAFREFGEMYQKNLFSELELIDELVSLCYKTRRHFKLFHSSVMLYFIATLHYEGQRLGGNQPQSFLSADNAGLRRTIREAATVIDHCLERGAGRTAEESAYNKIRELIAPYNSAGLMDPDKKNMYAHTAVMFD